MKLAAEPTAEDLAVLFVNGFKQFDDREQGYIDFLEEIDPQLFSGSWARATNCPFICIPRDDIAWKRSDEAWNAECDRDKMFVYVGEDHMGKPRVVFTTCCGYPGTEKRFWKYVKFEVGASVGGYLPAVGVADVAHKM